MMYRHEQSGNANLYQQYKENGITRDADNIRMHEQVDKFKNQ